jgi:acyl carrier protein
MDKQEIGSQIKTFLEEEFPDQGIELTESTDLLDAWFVDSLAVLNMALFLEKRFQIDIDQNDINGDNFGNIAALSALVFERRGGD